MQVMNRKGQASGFENMIFALAMIFGAALLFFIIFFIYGEIKTPLSEATTAAMTDGGASLNTTEFNDRTSRGLGSYNTLFPFLLVGMIIFVGVSLFYVESNPAMLFISLIIFGVFILLSVVFGNVFQAVSTSDGFEDTSDSFGITSFIMQYLPIIAIIIIGIGAVIMFRNKGGGGGL